jgi:hypothetical protein
VPLRRLEDEAVLRQDALADRVRGSRARGRRVGIAVIVGVLAALAAPAGVIAASDVTLLERYRPVLLYDRTEKWRVVAVDEFIADGLPPRLSDARTRPNARAVVYGRVVRDGGRKWLQYWLFFSYNGQDRGIVRTGRHEGDWELFQVRLADYGTPPDAATFSQHSSEAACRWDELVPDARGRAHVYVANASHALYPETGVHDRPFPDPNDVTSDYKISRPDVQVVTAAAPSWMQWDGRWGESRAGLVPGEKSSPRGPAHAGERWTEPAKLHDEARSCFSAPTSAWSVAPWGLVAAVVSGLVLFALRSRRRRRA